MPHRARRWRRFSDLPHRCRLARHFAFAARDGSAHGVARLVQLGCGVTWAGHWQRATADINAYCTPVVIARGRDSGWLLGVAAWTFGRAWEQHGE